MAYSLRQLQELLFRRVTDTGRIEATTEGFGCIPSSFVTELSWAENDSSFAKSRFPDPCLARVLTLLPPWIGLALGVPRFDSYLQVYRHNQYQKTDKMHCM